VAEIGEVRLTLRHLSHTARLHRVDAALVEEKLGHLGTVLDNDVRDVAILLQLSVDVICSRGFSWRVSQSGTDKAGRVWLTTRVVRRQVLIQVALEGGAEI